MGLYDNFRLQNSTQVYKQPGVPLDALGQTLGVLNERYDKSRATWDSLKRTLDQSPVHVKDRETFSKATQGIRDQISSVQKGGNYEDMMWAASDAGNQLASVYMPFAQENKRFQDRLEAIEKSDASAEDKKRLAIEAQMKYKGVQQDADGKWVSGGFDTPSIAKSIDMGKFVRETLSNMVAFENGYSNVSVEQAAGGEYFFNHDGKTTYIDADRVSKAIDQAVRLSPEVQDYLSQQGRLGTLGLDSLSYDDIAKGGDPEQLKVANQIKEQMAADPNLNFGQAYRQYFQGAIQQNLVNTAKGYGITNKAHKNTTTKTHVGGMTANGELQQHEAKANITKSIEADDVVFTEAEIQNNQYSGEESVHDLSNRLAESRTELKAKKDALSKARYQEDKDKIQAEISEIEGRLNGVLGQVGKGVEKFSGYLPPVIKTDKGNITKAQFQKAMKEGNFTSDGGVFGTGLLKDLVLTVDGKRVKISSSAGYDRFTDEMDKYVRQNSNNSNTKTMLMNVPKSLKQSTENLINSKDIGSVQFHDETGKPIRDGDDRLIKMMEKGKDFKVLTQEVRKVGTNSSSVLRGTYTDDDGKAKEFRISAKTDNNNWDAVAGRSLLDSRGRLPDKHKGAFMSLQNTAVKQLDDSRPNTPVKIGSGKNQIEIRKEITNGNRTSFRMYQNGQLMKDENGNVLYYDSSVEAVASGLYLTQ